MPHIAKITIFPIKSLDGVEVEAATVLESGALQYDREFAIVDAKGRFVNGKRHAKVHLLRSKFSLLDRIVSLTVENSDKEEVFCLDTKRQALETWLSDFFGFNVTLQQNTQLGFPDDTDSPGPTVISTATIAAVASWFEGVSVEDMRRRLRANLEIDGVPAFWEDQLFSATGAVVPFQIGDVTFLGVNSCQRCVVPTRDAMTGAIYPQFQKIFVTKRQETLPEWVAASRFNHFYRLSVNTRLLPSDRTQVIQLGDKVSLPTNAPMGI